MRVFRLLRLDNRVLREFIEHTVHLLPDLLVAGGITTPACLCRLHEQHLLDLALLDLLFVKITIALV